MTQEKPFKYEVSPEIEAQGDYSNLHSFEDNDSYIVKEMRNIHDFEDWQQKPIREFGVKEAAKEVGEGLSVLKKYLGDYLVPTMVVLGKGDENKESLYIVQERVLGESLANIDDEKLRAIEPALDNFFSSAIQMFLDTHEEDKLNGLFLDIFPGNFFVTFNKAGEAEKLILVDVYPLMRGSAFDALYMLRIMIKRFTENGFDLSKAKSQLEKLENLKDKEDKILVKKP